MIAVTLFVISIVVVAVVVVAIVVVAAAVITAGHRFRFLRLCGRGCDLNDDKGGTPKKSEGREVPRSSAGGA